MRLPEDPDLSKLPFVVDASGSWEAAHIVRNAHSAATSQRETLTVQWQELLKPRVDIHGVDPVTGLGLSPFVLPVRSLEAGGENHVRVFANSAIVFVPRGNPQLWL